MFNSSVLDVAIGVVMTFLALSLMTSAIVEALNSALKLRSRTLRAGVMALMNDPEFKGLAAQLYGHAAINPRGLAKSSVNTVVAPERDLPAYIDKQQFAAALLDLTGVSAASASEAAQKPGPAAVTALLEVLRTKGLTNDNPQIATLLGGIVERCQGDITLVRQDVADWFDSAMDRVGGAFKRWTQLASVLVALLLAFGLNLDALAIAHELWSHPTMVDQLKLPASMQQVSQGGVPAGTDEPARKAREQAALDAVKFLDASLPVGWRPGHRFEICPPGRECLPWWKSEAPLSLLLGWFLTALATLFGAPFWFDILQGAIRLKGAGPSPREKVSGRAASA